MKTIFKCIVGAIAIYFSINWIADHPKQVKAARQSMNKAVKRTKRYINDF
tara:strand:- start:325 stop:474 length:150 start_codon:yes stop_codon:yes gene_type:complete